MLTCHGCMRQCLQTIIGDSALLTAASRPTLTSSFNNVSLRRSYTGTSYERSRAGQEASRGRTENDRPNERKRTGDVSKRSGFGGDSSSKTQQPFRKGHQDAVSPRTIERKKWLDSRGIRPTSSPKKETTEREIRQHLTYLSDPLKLTDFVRQTLRRDEFDFAEELVRSASKNTKCVVSWNHLVEWQLSKGKMNAALSTYNEVMLLHRSIHVLYADILPIR